MLLLEWHCQTNANLGRINDQLFVLEARKSDFRLAPVSYGPAYYSLTTFVFHLLEYR